VPKPKLQDKKAPKKHYSPVTAALQPKHRSLLRLIRHRSATSRVKAFAPFARAFCKLETAICNFEAANLRIRLQIRTSPNRERTTQALTSTPQMKRLKSNQNPKKVRNRNAKESNNENACSDIKEAN